MNRHRCEHCGSTLHFNLAFDTHFCAVCNVWCNPVCDKPDCLFCKDRPEKPVKKEQGR